MNRGWPNIVSKIRLFLLNLDNCFAYICYRVGHGGLHLPEVSAGLPCYESFKHFLVHSGYRVFPEELTCPTASHPFVDIAARMGCHFWAFEYKSACDDISRAVDQALSYSEWFDYVVVVSERRLDHRTSETYWNLRRMGIGVWNYFPSSQRCTVQSNPALLAPDVGNRKSVLLRFSALARKRRIFESAVQHTLNI